MDIGLVVIAVAPIVFLGWYMYSRDRYDREPRRLVLKTFALGAVLVVPVIVAEVLGDLLLPSSTDLLGLLLHFMIVVALVEESSKYVAVRVSVYGSRAFNEPMDGLVYGAIAGLGFAAPENLLYVLNRGAVLGIVRAVLSVPGHALWGSIIGYYLARQKLDARRHMGLVGLVYAVLLHTIFDFGLVGADPLLGIAIASTVVLAGWTVFFRMKKSALAASPFRPEVLPPMPASMAVKYCISCGSAISVEDRFCRSCGALQL